MSRVERDFCRTLTCRVRAVVQASPIMRDEWQRRREAWWWLVLRVMSWFFFGLYALAFFPTIVSFLVLFPHVMRLYGSRDAILIPTADYALTPMTLAITGVLAFAMAGGATVLGPGASLSRHAYFPVSDRQLLNWTLRELLLNASLFTVCLVPAFTGIAVFERLTPWQIGGLVLCLGLQVGHGLALLVIVAPHVQAFTKRQLFLGVLGMVLILGGVAANGFNDRIFHYWHEVAALALATPVGWVHGAIAYGLIGGKWWGWLFLTPLPVTFWLVNSWLRRGYAIREVRIDSTGEVKPVFDWGLPNDPAIDADQPLPAVTPSIADSPELAAARVRKLILSGEAFAPLDWKKLGFIERCTAQLLPDRQRQMLVNDYVKPRWTRAWGIAAVIGLFPLWLLTLSRFLESHPGEPDLNLTSVLWLPTLFVAEGLAHLRWSDVVRHSDDADGTSCHPLFPVDLRELSAVVRRLFWLRLVFWLPMFLVVSTTLAAARSDWLAVLLVNLLTAVVLCRLVFLAAVSMPARSIASNSAFCWHRVAAMIPIVFFGMISAIASLFYFHWLFSLAALAILSAIGGTARRYWDWQYLHADADIVFRRHSRSKASAHVGAFQA
jgi:hypothetical protein